MIIGRRNRRISIQVNTPTRGSDGAEVEHWAEFIAAWAEFVPLRGDESFGSDQRRAEQRVEFKILRRTGITTQMRLMYKGISYNIRDVAEYGANNEGLKLICDAFEVQS